MSIKIKTAKSIKKISCHTAKSNIQKNNQETIYHFPNGNKNYIVVCCVSYWDTYDDAESRVLASKCYRYEYFDTPAKSVEDAVKITKKYFPQRLKDTISYSFYRDKKDVELDSIDEVYIQTVHDREYVNKN